MKNYFLIFAIALSLTFLGCSGDKHGNATQKEETEENIGEGTDFGADTERAEDSRIGGSDNDNVATGGVVTDTTGIDTTGNDGTPSDSVASGTRN